MNIDAEQSGGKGVALKRAGAVLMFLGVGLGAFGAHGLKEVLEGNGRMATWETAVFYHLIHGLAVWVLAYVAPDRRKVGFCFAAGVLVFSGSLYVLSLTNILWLGAITPLGGLLFLAGWGVLVVKLDDN
ncbi:MAG: DUF423 domain-containing protein [Verrucomicrobia bacterium]|nr:DUF423 domain-containing protein [Verrucomicrobiota bacterium]